jgi:SAM-dependent methyltransferase
MTYTRRPELYDVEYGFKDYAAEAARVEELIRARSADARTLLDVACGTGKHLEQLQSRFDEVEGLDLDEGLLAIARRRLPDVRFHRGDMRTFDLGRQFDAVTCLFSSIGFALDLDALAAAVGRLAAHVAPAGVLLVEPWVTPERWVPGRPHLLTAEREGLVFARVTHPDRNGRISTTDMHYLVGTRDGVESYREVHELGLFTEDEMCAALDGAGLAVEHDPEGLIGRGLWIGRR